MRKLVLVGLLGGLFLVSCQREQAKPMSIVVITDTSASIEPEARIAMFKAVESTVKDLRRGDSLTLIPVMNDAEVDSPGQIVRLEVPTEREVYDDDLRKLALKAREALEGVQARALETPSRHTDLLGALRLASEELAALPRERQGVVVILTDCIQDDAAYNFKSEPALARPGTAKQLATDLASGNGHKLNAAASFIGRLKSSDLSRLSRSRREAIEEFWREYLTQLGSKPEVVVDGPGLLARFIARSREGSDRRR